MERVRSRDQAEAPRRHCGVDPGRGEGGPVRDQLGKSPAQCREGDHEAPRPDDEDRRELSEAPRRPLGRRCGIAREAVVPAHRRRAQGSFGRRLAPRAAPDTVLSCARVQGDLRISAALSRREQALASRDGQDVSALPDKLDAIRAAERAFDRIGCPHALIGGLAVGVRSGVPRATLDVDYAIASYADLEAIATAFAVEGLVRTGTFAHSVNFRHASGEPVQLALDPRFDAMVARAEVMVFGDLRVPVVTKGDLIAMKRLAAADPGRRRSKSLRDQADIALLEGDVPEPDEGW